ncbi:MAG: phage tail tape measure protein, partial [Cetobacterium sp.]
NESKKKLSPEGKVELGFAKGEATTINGVAKAVDKVIVSLKTLNEEKQKIAPNGDIRFNFSFGNKEELIEMSKYIKQIGSAIKLYNKGIAEMQKDGKTLNVVIKNTTETINNNSNKLLDLTRVTNMATKATRAKTQANKDLAKSEASVTGAKVGTAIGGETVAPTSSGVGSFATQSLIKNFKSSTKATDSDTKAKVANTRAGNANSKATMQNAMALSMMVSWIRSYSQSYAELSSATFAVGIAGQMSISQIDGLNRTFLNMSAIVPSSAKELALATDALIRTGRSFEESRIIIAETAMLASASGSNLKDTAEVVTKVMVALDISAERTSGTLNTMHSTAIQTASDMKYLAEAFKNVAGSASVLVKSSGLGGKELDDYKQRILDVSMASIGSMANLGVSASSAGTKVKQMLGRLVSAEKVAKTMFNTSMELSAIK